MKFKAKQANTLLALLTTQGGYATTSKARELIKNGAIWVNNIQVKIPSTAISKNQEIEVNPERSKLEERHGKYLFKVLFEDAHYIAAIKPPRVAVSKSKGKDPSFRDMVLKPILDHSPGAQIFPINYVETNASGIVLFAKNQKAQHYFEDLDKIQMHLLCLLEGRISPDLKEINAPLVTQPTMKKVLAIEKMTKLSEEAQTKLRLIKHIGRFSLVEVAASGLRKKQLQAHFQFINMPIAGAKKYGAKLPFKARVGIHLYKLSFYHPVTKANIELEATVPQTFTRAGKYI